MTQKGIKNLEEGSMPHNKTEIQTVREREWLSWNTQTSDGKEIRQRVWVKAGPQVLLEVSAAGPAPAYHCNQEGKLFLLLWPYSVPLALSIDKA